MKSNTKRSTLFRSLRGLAASVIIAGAPCLSASTIWNGPTITFTHAPPANLEDQLTPDVAFTRGSSGGLYNAMKETGATANISPKGTRWAVGALTNYNKLTYGPCPLEEGHRPPNLVGTNFVVHLTNDDIYFSLTLTGWGGAGGNGNKTFTYTRSTAAVVPPTVTITNPPSGAVFAAPANVTITANAAASSGTVTNVGFFTNNILAGSVLTAPFSFTAGNLTAGAHALTAVATASGISATSAAVNVTVVSPVAVSISGAQVNAGQFSFNYTANAGLSYVVQSSSDLENWAPLVTNVAAGSLVPYSNTFTPNGDLFYRVGQLPNP